MRVLGNPPASVVAFAPVHGSKLNVLAVGDTMSKKGWHLNAISNPAAVHIACTVRLFLCLLVRVLTALYVSCLGCSME